VFSAAVKRGDMEILMWLREKECPWNADCFKVALDAKRFDIVKWLHEGQCPHNNETAQIMTGEFFKLYEQQQKAV
jgi:hypothetical protein